MSIIQKNVIYKALSDPKFGKDIFTQLPLSDFEGGVTRELVQIIKRYYVSHTRSLDQETLLTLAEKHIEKRKLKDEESDELFSKVDQAYEVSEEANEAVREETIQRFVRKSLSIKALQETMNTQDLEDDGVVEELSDKLREIAVIDATGNDGGDIDFFEEFDKRVDLYEKQNTNTVPTGFDNLDVLLEGGGIGVGQMGTVIAGTGTGKSTVLIQLLNNAIKNGLNAMFISLEEHDSRMTSRIETNLIGKSRDYFLTVDGKVDREKYQALNKFYQHNLDEGTWGNLYIRTRRPYTVTVEDIEQIVIDLKVKRGKELDVVIIDYPEIMRKRSAPNSRDEDIMGETFHRIKGLADKYGFVAWTVAQTNRTAGDVMKVTAHNIQGAYKVTNSTDVLLTMNRTTAEKKEDCFRLFVDKLRYPEPTAIVPEFLYFKTIVKEGFQVVPESDTEIARHQAMLKESNYQNSSDEEVAANYGKAMDNVNNNLEF